MIARLASFAALILVVLAGVVVTQSKAQSRARAGMQPGVELIAATRLEHPDPWFGGFSAINMAPDGASAVLLSDRGWWLHPQVRRDPDGVITGIARWQLLQLKDAQGKKLRGPARDSEGLARLPDGRICVSFEGLTRVACYDTLNGRAQTLPRPDVFESFPTNRGLEALAADHRGYLYAIPERAVARGKPAPVYVWNKTDWAVRLTLPPQGRFYPVGADVFGDHLYVLYRGLGFVGFKSRLIRLPLSGGAPVILLDTRPGTHDNLEGLSLWRNPAGDIVATMVSDDNQMRRLQRTEIVEYRLPEPPHNDTLASGAAKP